MDEKIIPIQQASKTESRTPLSRQNWRSQSVGNDPRAQMRLAELLTDAFTTMNTFGRTPESLTAIIRLFQADLGGYPIEAVELAFASWRQNNSAFPTPFDILNILRFDPDESVEDPNGYAGWYVKRSDLKPGDQGYIKPPALWREIGAAVAAMNAPHGRMIGDIASGIIRQIERQREDG